MAKIALVDLSFTWPPDGGARTDVREIGFRLAKENDVRLFVPNIQGWIKLGSKWVKNPLDRTRFFWKGKIEGDVGFEVSRVDFGPISFGKKGVGRRFKEAIDDWKPDHVFITDGWYLKPYVIDALRDYEPICRIYAHEMLCLKGNGFFYRWGKPCTINYLKGGISTHMRCNICTSSFYMTYPSPTWIHEYLSAGAMFPGYPETVRRALGLTKHVIVYNEFTADRIRPYAKSVKIVPSGVDTKRFFKEDAPTPGPKVILCVGRTEEPRKGVQVLIEAGRELRKQRQDFEIWLTDSKDLGIPWVKHLGWVPINELRKVYNQSSIFVVPSLWPEPHGIVALEAMACGVPVIVSRIGGLRETCDDGLTGFHFDPGNQGELRLKINQLLDTPELSARVAENGRKAVLDRYQWDHILENDILPLF